MCLQFYIYNDYLYKKYKQTSFYFCLYFSLKDSFESKKKLLKIIFFDKCYISTIAPYLLKFNNMRYFRVIISSYWESKL